MRAPAYSNPTGRKGTDRTKHTPTDSSLDSPTPSTASVGSPVTTFNDPCRPSSPLGGAFRALNLNEPSIIDERPTNIKTPALPASQGAFSSRGTFSSEASINTPPLPSSTGTDDTFATQILSGRSTPVVDLNPSLNSSIFNTPRQEPAMDPQLPDIYWLCTPFSVVAGQEPRVCGRPLMLREYCQLPAISQPSSSQGIQIDPEESNARPLASANTAPRAGTTILTAMDTSVPPSDISMPLAPDATTQSDTIMRSTDTIIRHAPDDSAVEEVSSGDYFEVDKEENNDSHKDADENKVEDNEAVFGPIEIQQYAKSCHPFREGEKTLGLPHSIYTAWNSAAYDPLWMENVKIANKDILKAFISKLKMDELIGKGGLPIGFELYIEVQTTDQAGNTTMVEKLARIVAFESGTAFNSKAQKEYKKKLPDFEIFVAGIKKSQYKRCDGPSKLLQALNDLDPKPAPTKGKKSDVGAWKGLQARHSNGTNLGSLYDVRQTYHRWEIEMDAWSAVTGTHTRNRRPYKPVTVGSVVGTDEE